MDENSEFVSIPITVIKTKNQTQEKHKENIEKIMMKYMKEQDEPFKDSKPVSLNPINLPKIRLFPRFGAPHLLTQIP